MSAEPLLATHVLDTYTKMMLEQIIVSSTEELFEAYAMPLRRLDEPPVVEGSEITYLGIIGFAGRSLRGTLLLAPATLALTESNWRTRGELRDWIGELSNQLLGRIKNKLLRCGVEMHVTIPLTMRGSQLAPAATRGELMAFSFDAEPGRVAVWLDVETAEGFKIEFSDDSEQNLEGDAIVF